MAAHVAQLQRQPQNNILNIFLKQDADFGIRTEEMMVKSNNKKGLMLILKKRISKSFSILLKLVCFNIAKIHFLAFLDS